MSVARSINRLPALYALSLPGVCGLLCLYGVYDAVQYRHWGQALWGMSLVVLFTAPIALVASAEVGYRRFVRFLDENAEAIGAGTARYRGIPLCAESELVVYPFAISLIVASFKIPSRFHVAGAHSDWLHRIGYGAISAIFGWWGIPWGPVYTLQCLSVTAKGGERVKLLDLLDAPKWESGGGKLAG